MEKGMPSRFWIFAKLSGSLLVVAVLGFLAVWSFSQPR